MITLTQAGHVQFHRHDGVAIVQISAALSPAAALKLEVYLRELVATDQPMLTALVERQQQELERAQLVALERITGGGPIRDA